MSGTVTIPSTLMTTNLASNTTGDIGSDDVRSVVESLAALPIFTTTQTASFNVSDLTMRGTMVLYNSASGGNATLVSDATTAYQVGTLIHFRPIGAGMITFVQGSGATVTSSSGTLVSRATGSWCTAHKTAANTWYVDGDLS